MKWQAFIIFILPVLLPVSVMAGTVVYTTRQHLPVNLSPDIAMVLLDEPEHLQTKIFGQLPVDPDQATEQVKQVISSPGGNKNSSSW